MARTANITVEMSPEMEKAFKELAQKMIEINTRMTYLENAIKNMKPGEVHNHYHSTNNYPRYPGYSGPYWGGAMGSGGITYTTK